MKKKRKKRDKATRSFIRFILCIFFIIATTIIIYEYYRKDILFYKEKIKERIESVYKENSAQKEPAMQPAPSISNGELPYYDESHTEQIIFHKGYTVAYNSPFRTPKWVAYELTREEAKGNIKRNDKFVPDPKARGISASNKDYTNSGYDKGHMAPAGDMKWDITAMQESFYFTNICPQEPTLNRGVWKKLEENIRQQVEKDSIIWIVCGPLFSKEIKTIGANKIRVPDYFFKVIVTPYTSPPKGIGFLFNNRPPYGKLREYSLSINSIENLTHIDFFHLLPDTIENYVESQNSIRDWYYIRN